MPCALASALGAQAAAPALTITDTARALQPGEVVVLTIDTGNHADAVHVRAFNRNMPALRVDALHWRALVGIDLDVRPGRHPIAVEAVAAAKTIARDARAGGAAAAFSDPKTEGGRRRS